jgi:hypothetical protein
MAEQKSKPTAIQLLGWTTLGAGLWGVTFVFTNQRLGSHHDSAAIRIVLVALGIGGALPWAYFCRKAILAEDEFSQRIHFVAMSITFALTAVGSYACGFLERAGFIPELPLSDLWLVMVVVWWISILATSRYYR